LLDGALQYGWLAATATPHREYGSNTGTHDGLLTVFAFKRVGGVTMLAQDAHLQRFTQHMPLPQPRPKRVINHVRPSPASTQKRPQLHTCLKFHRRLIFFFKFFISRISIDFCGELLSSQQQNSNLFLLFYS